MGSSSNWPPENRQLRREMQLIEEELARGKTMADQLKILLQNPPQNATLFTSYAQNIETSFTQAISLIAAAADASSGTTQSAPSSATKNRRGCYKRRKGADSWEKFSTTTEDNYAWRKYGQKKIHNSHHPRCYYRCTNKHTESCNAVKQVQQIPGEQLLYHITYIGQHTCQDTATLRTPNSSIIFDHDSDLEDFSLTGFESTMVDPSFVKEEAHDHGSVSAETDSITWPAIVSDAQEEDAFDAELIY